MKMVVIVIYKIKSLLCIIFLCSLSINQPMVMNPFVTQLINNKAHTHSKSEGYGIFFSISCALPLLYTLPGLILGGYALWRVNKQEKYVERKIKTSKNKYAEYSRRTDKEIADLQQDVICLNSDISLIRDNIAVLDDDISVFNKLHSDFVRTKNELEKYRELAVSLTEENMLFKEAIGEKVDCALFNLKPRIDSLELKVKNLKDRMVYRETMPPMPHMMYATALYDSSRTASTSSSG